MSSYKNLFVLYLIIGCCSAIFFITTATYINDEFVCPDKSQQISTDRCVYLPNNTIVNKIANFQRLPHTDFFRLLTLVMFGISVFVCLDMLKKIRAEQLAQVQAQPQEPQEAV